MTYCYRVHGLTVTSAFPISELAPVVGHTSDADIEIVRASKNPRWNWPGQVDGTWMSVSPDKSLIRLEVENCASFLVTDGRLIHVDSDMKNAPRRMMAYLLGRVLGAAMYQRQQFLLHASAVRVSDGVVLFVGERGAGKSTLTAEMDRLGYPLWADDVARIEFLHGAAMMPAGIQRNKLWADTLAWFGQSTDGLDVVEEQQGKYHLPAPEITKDLQSLPVRAIVELSKQNADEISLTTVSKIERFQTIAQHNYMLEFVPTLGLAQEFLDFCARLQSDVPFYRLQAPRGLEHLGDIAGKIIALGDYD